MGDGEALRRLSQPWLDDDGAVYQHTDAGNSPCKDYFSLTLTAGHVVLREWKIISPYRLSKEDSAPKLYRSSYEDFRLDNEIRMRLEHFCRSDLKYVDDLICGKIDYLSRLDRKTLFGIIDYLDCCSVVNLSATNRFFRKLCHNNKIWKKLFARSHLHDYTTPGLWEIVDTHGWKAFYTTMCHIRRKTDELERGKSEEDEDFWDLDRYRRRSSSRLEKIMGGSQGYFQPSKMSAKGLDQLAKRNRRRSSQSQQALQDFILSKMVTEGEEQTTSSARTSFAFRSGTSRASVKF